MRNAKIWSLAGLLGCTASRPGEPPTPLPGVDNEGLSSSEPQMPVTYACRAPPVEAAITAGYRFELDGEAFVPERAAQQGQGPWRRGDVIRVAGIKMVLGSPGWYRYAVDPMASDAVTLSLDGAPPRLVGIRLTRLHRRGQEKLDPSTLPRDEQMPAVRRVEAESVASPLSLLDHPRVAGDIAALRSLRGLSLEIWNEPIAAMLARLDAAEFFLEYTPSREVDPQVPEDLPRGLEYLRLGLRARRDADELAGELGRLAQLPRLRHLELQLDGVGDPSLPASALAGLVSLERLDFENDWGRTGLTDLEGLATLKTLRALNLRGFRDITSINVVAMLPELRVLDLVRTQVSDLRPVAGHPTLEIVRADFCPLTEFPATLPAHLRELSIVSAPVSALAVEALAAQSPGTWIRHGRNQALADVLACAEHLRVRSGGLCHRKPREERTLLEVVEPAALRELLPLLAIDESVPESDCLCCGSPTLEFYRDGALIAELGVHHRTGLRWYGWPSDGQIQRPAALCAWLVSRGWVEACGGD